MDGLVKENESLAAQAEELTQQNGTLRGKNAALEDEKADLESEIGVLQGNNDSRMEGNVDIGLRMRSLSWIMRTLVRPSRI